VRRTGGLFGANGERFFAQNCRQYAFITGTNHRVSLYTYSERHFSTSLQAAISDEQTARYDLSKLYNMIPLDKTLSVLYNEPQKY
jgi:hypothetical protein